MTVTANGKSIAWKFSAWAWGKVIPTDVQELEDFFNRFLEETGIKVVEVPERGPKWLTRGKKSELIAMFKQGHRFMALKELRELSRANNDPTFGLRECKDYMYEICNYKPENF